LGEGVEVGVGGGVVGLAGGAQGGGDRGEQDECRELQVGAQLVQVPGSLCLGVEDVLEALGVEVCDQAVIEDAGGVDDRA
jgi:hypothetical protein